MMKMSKNKKWIVIIISCFCALALLGILGYFIYLKSAFISKEQVKEIVIKDTQLSEDDISFKEIDLDLEEETKKYDVEFYYNRVEYNYEIEAKTGKIIYSNYNNNQNTDNNSTSIVTDNYISAEEAKSIALADAGLNNNEVTFVDIDLDLRNNQAIYEIDFETNTLEYDYKIDGFSKNIINKNTEPRD